MNIVDVIIAIPAIPGLFLLGTWWLPWESWIPWGKLPKIPLGLYILYLSFGGWYFDGGWWIVIILFCAGGAVLLMGLREKYRKRSSGGDTRPNSGPSRARPTNTSITQKVARRAR